MQVAVADERFKLQRRSHSRPVKELGKGLSEDPNFTNISDDL